MVREVLLAIGLEHMDFSLVPFPINLPALYRYYLPLDATFYLTIYDEWGKRKLDQFRASGLKTEVLWSKDPKSKDLNAGEIRKRMAFGQEWEHLVPRETEILMKKWGVPERIKRLYEIDAAGSRSCD
jgi:hypothetical protein